MGCGRSYQGAALGFSWTDVKVRAMGKRKDEDWLSVPEVMKRLGLSRAAIYYAVSEGRLKGQRVKVTREELRIDAQSVAEFEVSKSHQKRGRLASRTPKPGKQ